jgi:uncharacterized membrane protein
VSPDTGSIGLIVAAFVASAVEFIEAFTIVLAIGITRGWRSTLWGVGLALLALTAITAVAGYTLVEWFPEAALQLGIGTLLLIFGLQWLRKAILRSAGLKALHDEDETFRQESAAALAAGTRVQYGLDWFAFIVSFKGVFLEGLEVVFIVITLGLNANSIPLAAAGASAAAAIVLVAGALAHRPLANVPENTLKFTVGLLLTTFGTYWAVEGLGSFGPSSDPLTWPAGDWALLGLLALWLSVSQLAIVVLRRTSGSRPPAAEVTE